MIQASCLGILQAIITLVLPMMNGVGLHPQWQTGFTYLWHAAVLMENCHAQRTDSNSPGEISKALGQAGNVQNWIYPTF